MSLKVAIRVDASLQIGTGHLMRCLTLANELISRGLYVRFVSRHMPEHLQQMINASGCEFNLLASIADEENLDDLAHSAWLGASQLNDAKDSIEALGDYRWDWLIVDHYAIDRRWESELRVSAKNILVIDDIADREHDCDVLLDQNFYIDMESRYINKVSKNCQLLLGPTYALLRNEFRGIRKQLIPRDGVVKNILIFFGGIDADNYTSQAIHALINLNKPELKVNVVIGAQHPFRSAIQDTCSKYGFTCHVQTNRIAELMAEADFSIGAGGSATWERCCLGLPTMAICTADNQFKQITDAASKWLVYAPDLKGELSDSITRHMNAVTENRSLLSNISAICMDAVDGLGVSRVLLNIESRNIEVRLADCSDSHHLFEWRNHPAIREFSRNTGIIKWEDHLSWLDSTLSNPERFLLIGHYQNNPVGVVRFDINGNEAEVSIYLVPNIDLRGFGRPLLKIAENWLSKKRPDINKVNAHVLGDNVRSQHLFSRAGYKVESTCYSKRLH